MTAPLSTTRAVLVLCAIAALPGYTATAPAARLGAISGRVTFPGAVPPAGARPTVGELGGPAMAMDPVDRRRSVVYIDAVPRQAFDELPAGHARMDQRNEQFSPRVLAITVGTVVDFPNNDTKFHNVFSLSRAQPFDLGRYRPGRTGGVRFNHPGLVRVFCDIHSHMSGYILVFSHRYFTLTDDQGRYTIPNVPAGSYTLMIWSELGHADSKRVTVGDGTVTEADFQVGRLP